MGKTELMAIGTLVKSLIALIAITMTISHFVMGIIKRDNKRLKKAGLTFVVTCLTLLVLSGIEFLLLPDY